jgi:hypothetical protein
MTTSAPQWPGQDGGQEGHEAASLPADARVGERPGLRTVPRAPGEAPAERQALRAAPGGAPGLRAAPGGAPGLRAGPVVSPGVRAARGGAPGLRAVPDGAPGDVVGGVEPVREQVTVPVQPRRREAVRRGRFVLVRDQAERELRSARRRARASLPSPVAVTRDIALALLEVEAGCRSAAQLERVFSRALWEALEHRIGRRGGPLPSGRSLLTIQCQEDTPGLADTVAVVQKGECVRPVALRLDASAGRWTVTELRWWRNETDTAATSGRDGRSS